MNERMRLKLFLGLLLFFMVYMLVVGVAIIYSVFTGNFTKWIDFALYIGNVVAFGLSFYVIAKAKTTKLPFMKLLGVFIMVVNGWGIFRYLML